MTAIGWRIDDPLSPDRRVAVVRDRGGDVHAERVSEPPLEVLALVEAIEAKWPFAVYVNRTIRGNLFGTPEGTLRVDSRGLDGVKRRVVLALDALDAELRAAVEGAEAAILGGDDEPIVLDEGGDF